MRKVFRWCSDALLLKAKDWPQALAIAVQLALMAHAHADDQVTL